MTRPTPTRLTAPDTDHVEARVNSVTGHAVVLAVAPGTPAEVVDAAFDLAAERGAPLLAVSAWHDPNLPLGGWLRPERTARWDAAHHKAGHDLDRALEVAAAAHPTVEVETVVVDDDLVPFLIGLSNRAELLVLGRPTRPGHSASPVDALVRQAACPVLVVPASPRPPTWPAYTVLPSGG
jgi:nucleotide-binding universal stress UspA family protein